MQSRWYSYGVWCRRWSVSSIGTQSSTPSTHLQLMFTHWMAITTTSVVLFAKGVHSLLSLLLYNLISSVRCCLSNHTWWWSSAAKDYRKRSTRWREQVQVSLGCDSNRYLERIDRVRLVTESTESEKHTGFSYHLDYVSFWVTFAGRQMAGCISAGEIQDLSIWRQ